MELLVGRPEEELGNLFDDIEEMMNNDVGHHNITGKKWSYNRTINLLILLMFFLN